MLRRSKIEYSTMVLRDASICTAVPPDPRSNDGVADNTRTYGGSQLHRVVEVTNTARHSLSKVSAPMIQRLGSYSSKRFLNLSTICLSSSLLSLQFFQSALSAMLSKPAKTCKWEMFHIYHQHPLIEKVLHNVWIQLLQ